MTKSYMQTNVYTHMVHTYAYTTIRRQTNSQSVKSQTGQLAKMFDLNLEYMTALSVISD